jgi:RNA polymerase sigma-70 factor, ECF subfamily
VQTPAADIEFTALLDAHKGILYKVGNAYATNAEDRADLMQEIAAQWWRSFPRYDRRFRFSTWAYRIALNVGISFFRRERRRERTYIEAGDSVLEIVGDDPRVSADDGRVRALHGFIATLPPLDRALILLYLDGHRHDEIAEVLGISVSNVGTRFGRIKQRLRGAFSAAT